MEKKNVFPPQFISLQSRSGFLVHGYLFFNCFLQLYLIFILFVFFFFIGNLTHYTNALNDDHVSTAGDIQALPVKPTTG